MRALDGFGNLNIVADDSRYPHEVKAIHHLSGIVARIDRSGAGSATGAGHSSEVMAFEPDHILRNAGSK